MSGLRWSESDVADYEARQGRKQSQAATERKVALSQRGIKVDTGKRPKYGNRKTIVDSIVFDSAREAARYSELRLLERAGKISGLRLQPSFDLVMNESRVCRFQPDFKYVENGQTVIEDVKSKPTRTRMYLLKKKMLKAQYGLAVKEVY